MDRVLFIGGRVVDPASGNDRTADVLVADGVIAEVGKVTDAKAEKIDISGAVLCPGFVDLHVHLREPGREDEETIASGSASAAAGGFTAIVAMPNTDPACDNAAVAEKVHARGRTVGLTEVHVAGAITKGREGKNLAAIGEMVRCAARVRMFTDDGSCVEDPRLVRRAMEYIKGFDAIYAEHCEDPALAAGGQMNEGEFSSSLGLIGSPVESEEIALGRDLALVKLTGVRFHALHISTAGSVEMIRRAKAQGLRVTAEVTPHHFALTDAELISYDTNFKMNPPLRTSADVDAIKVGLADGTIDAIATDHAPHSAEEKEAEFELAPSGLIGLETALAVAVTELFNPGHLDLTQLVQLLSIRPARLLGVDGQGGPIEAGAPAHIAVFDPQASWTVDPIAFMSMSRNTPWAGRQLTGRVLHTVFDGRLVASNGAVLEEVPA